MEIELEKVVDIYREVTAIPNVIACNILKDGDYGYCLESLWQQSDLEREENITYVKCINFCFNGSAVNNVVQFPPTEINKELITRHSQCGELKAIVREILDKDKKKIQYMEVWSKNKKIVNINLKDADKHGDVISNDQFGSLEWSKDGKKVVYIAESKKTKSLSYFKAVDKKNSTTGEKVDVGNEHLWKESWGEQLTDCHKPTICVLDILSKDISVFCDVLPSDVSAGQAIWHHSCESIIFIGWRDQPYRLGLRYCPIRQSSVYMLHIEKNICKWIYGENQSIRSPRLHPEKNKLFFLENCVGGPHMQCSRLLSIDLPLWDDQSKVNGAQEVTGIVKTVKDVNDFPGLYLMNLSYNCWSMDGNHVFLTSFWRSHKVVLVINLITGKVKRLTMEGETALLDVKDDVVVVCHTRANLPPEIRIGKFEKDVDMKWTTVIQPCQPLKEIKWSIYSYTPDLPNLQYPGLDPEYILYQPSVGNNYLVIFPHGGPHSHSTTGFMKSVAGMCKLGFTVVHINYRGSTGFGNDSVYSLPSRIGKQDVHDVHQVSKKVKDEFGFDKVFVTGGSHGGFLALHLIGQFPDFYCAAVVRNPVVNLASIAALSDIPDWALCESGASSFDFDVLPCSKSYGTMLEVSPIIHISKAKAPVLMLLGDIDLRVPPSQGKEWARKYRALGRECKVLVYKDNNHPLSKVDAEADAFVNMIVWFQRHKDS